MFFSWLTAWKRVMHHVIVFTMTTIKIFLVMLIGDQFVVVSSVTFLILNIIY